MSRQKRSQEGLLQIPEMGKCKARRMESTRVVLMSPTITSEMETSFIEAVGYYKRNSDTIEVLDLSGEYSVGFDGLNINTAKEKLQREVLSGDFKFIKIFGKITPAIRAALLLWREQQFSNLNFSGKKKVEVKEPLIINKFKNMGYDSTAPAFEFEKWVTTGEY